MPVNFEGSVVQLRDKMTAPDKKKTTQSESSQKPAETKKSSSPEAEKHYMADVIGIRNENRLAAAGKSIESQEEAFDMIEELKKQFMDNSERAMNAHKKASADAVMQFYPFE